MTATELLSFGPWAVAIALLAGLLLGLLLARPREAAASDGVPEAILQVDSERHLLNVRGAWLLLVYSRPEKPPLESMLESRYQLLVEHGRIEALKTLRESSPNLVLVSDSIGTSEMVELCAAIRADEALKSIPVLLITSRDNQAGCLEAIKAGANDHVPRPICPAALLSRVGTQLQLRALFDRLVQSERLAAIGSLSAGMVHELRNPLNSVLNGARVLLERGDESGVRERLLPLVVDGAERMESILSALGSHARTDVEEPAAFDLRESLLSSLRLMAHRSREIEISTDLEDSCRALGVEGPTSQVIVNLLDNALRSGAKHISVKAFRNRRRWLWHRSAL
jgi:signal transduction histidine kinase